MQTLRFYTKRIFALVCFFFFAFLILMTMRNGPSDSDTSRPKYFFGGDERGHPKQIAAPHIPQMPPHPGEQLSFQPQVPPVLNAKSVKYSDLNVDRKKDKQLIDRIQHHLKDFDLKSLFSQECKKNVTLAEYWLDSQNRVVPTQDSWERFYAQIGTCDLYHNDQIIDELLYDLNKMPIKHTAIMEGGTQVKLILTFENDKQAVFKPMRFGRDYETDPNHFYFGDFERHTAEIATFHMDRILGYRRAVPTVGRVVNMTEELRDKAERRLRKTFFVSPAKNHCFVSKCDYYCDTTHAICGTPDLKEGSVQVFLPDDTSVPRRHNKSPYRRTYSKKTQLALWQQDMRYCQWKVKTRKQYAHGRRLLDLVDLHIMDYMIINQDRHHYETFTVFGDIPSYAIHLDNGRAFGRTDIDDDDILMPLRQCCVIRPSTLAKLLQFYAGPKGLTETFHESLSKDPTAPILAFKHYNALERRLHKIMQYILECMDKQPNGLNSMVMTEFHNTKVADPMPGEDIDATEDETENDNNINPPPADDKPPDNNPIPAPDQQNNAAPNDKAGIPPAG